jgi:F-type H+-transporting ATPase subunit a
MSIYSPLADVGIPVVVQSAFLAGAMLVLTGLAVRRELAASADGGLIPDARLSLRNLVELVVDALVELARDIIGPEYERFMGLVGTLFLFILLSNFMGLIPGVGGSTSFYETTWAWAIVSFVVYNYVGIRKHGRRYILQFCGPSFDIPLGGGREIHFPVLFWFFIPLEVPLHLARMLTLSVRLLANMFADHLVVGLWLGLMPFLVPALFLGLGAMVAVVQAFVFTLLTMTYIGMALAEPH